MKLTQFLKKHAGFRQFLVKTGLFILLFVLTQIIVVPILRLTKLNNFPPFRILDLGVAFLFSLILLFILIKDKIIQLPRFTISLKEKFLYSTLFLLSLSLYLLDRYFVSHNFDFVLNNLYWFWVILMCLLILATFLFLALAIFGKQFFNYLITKFKNKILVSFSLTIFISLIIFYIRYIWTIFAVAIAKSVEFLLNLFFSTVSVDISNIEHIILRVNDFSVSLGQECSGIESMTLFIILYTFIFILDRKLLNRKRMLMILLPGIIGTFFVNVLRVFTLLVVGIYTSQEFAVGMFHSNAGWLLFLGYFFIFWYFAYPWVKLKKSSVKR